MMKKLITNILAYTIVILFFVILFLMAGIIVKFLASKLFASSTIQYQTEEYVVSAGETLWSIACENKKDNQDVREYVYQLRQLNDIDNCIIVPGQTIQIIK